MTPDTPLSETVFDCPNTGVRCIWVQDERDLKPVVLASLPTNYEELPRTDRGYLVAQPEWEFHDLNQAKQDIEDAEFTDVE